MNAQSVSVWLALVSASSVGIARFVAVEERSDNQTRWISELNSKFEQQREEIEALRNDRAMLERIHAIELRLAAMDAASGQKSGRR